MKLYYFNPNDHDIEYFIMDESKKNALESLLDYLKSQNDIISEKEFDLWKNVDADNPSTYPKSYSIDVFEKGQVVMSELS